MKPLKIQFSLVALLAVAFALPMHADRKKDWRAAEATDSIVGYEQFLKKYPEGKHSSYARSRIDDLRRPAVSARVATQPIVPFLSSKRFTPPDPAENNAVIVTLRLAPGRYSSDDISLRWDDDAVDRPALGHRAGGRWVIKGTQTQSTGGGLSHRGTTINWSFTRWRGGDTDFLFVVPKRATNVSLFLRG